MYLVRRSSGIYHFRKMIICPDSGRAKSIRRHCVANLESFMVAKDIETLLELPKTDTLKTSKKEWL